MPEIFSWLQNEGNLSEEEMARTFNCGIGAVLVVQKEMVQQILKDVQRHEKAWVIGRVVSVCTGYGGFIYLKPMELSSLVYTSQYKLV